MLVDFSSDVAYMWSILFQWLRYCIDFLDNIQIASGVTLWLFIIAVDSVLIICDLIFFVNGDEDMGHIGKDFDD